jgi:hypothetical protein
MLVYAASLPSSQRAMLCLIPAADRVCRIACRLCTFAAAAAPAAPLLGPLWSPAAAMLHAAQRQLLLAIEDALCSRGLCQAPCEQPKCSSSSSAGQQLQQASARLEALRGGWRQQEDWWCAAAVRLLFTRTFA